MIAPFPIILCAETTGEAYLRLAQGISGLTYGDFIWQRTPSYCESNPDLKASFEHLDRAMAVETNLAELTELTKHPEPKVRTLAIMRLYNMEEPAALRVICSRSGDMAGTFPGRSFLTYDHASDRMLLDTTPYTVSKLANLMCEQAGFPPLGQDDAAIGAMAEDWTGWYQYLYFRASGRSSPILSERTPKILAVRKKIDVLPPTTRAWMLLAIGAIDLRTNESCDPRLDPAPPIALEKEMIAAAKQLGPDVLITYLRDGSRTGLRDPKCNGPKEDRGFILEHARVLFRKQDAEALKSMGEIIAAADADPERASQLIREELDRRDKEQSTYGRGKAIAALLDLRGDGEADFIVNMFYQGMRKNDPIYEQQEFIRELKRRKPREWRNTLRGIVEHTGFERLDKLTLVYFAMMTVELGKTSIPTNQDNRNLPAPQISNLLRAYFGLPQAIHRTLEERIESVKPPALTVKLPIAVEFIELSPDGSILAAVPREGHLHLFSTADGKALGSLATEGQIRAVHFGYSNGRLMTLNSDKLLQTWDIATAKEISRVQSDTLAIYSGAIFNSTGEFLVTASQGFTVVDLASLKPLRNIEMRTRGNGMFRLSPDDKRLAINDGFGKTIQFFDVATAKPFATLEGHGDVPIGTAFSPDGEIFVSWDNEGGKIMLWNGKTGVFMHEFTHPDGLLPWLVFTADSKHMLCCTEQRLNALFDIKTGIASRAFAYSTDLGGRALFFNNPPRISKDGKRLVSVNRVQTGKRDQYDTYLECWDLSQ